MGGIRDFDVDDDARIASTKLAAGRLLFGQRTAAFPLGQRNIGAVLGILFDPGRMAKDILRVAANVADGETVTFGPFILDGASTTDVFEVDIINTDSTVDTAANIAATGDPVLVTFSAPLAILAGALFRVESEIFKVLRVISTTQVVAARARSGTVAALHTAPLDVFISNAAPASNISVGLVTTLTPAAFIAAFVAELNNALAGTERDTTRSSRVYKLLTATGFTNEVLVAAKNPQILDFAVSETLAGANNVWASATLYGSAEPAVRRRFLLDIVPNATEVALGFIRIPLPFTPTVLPRPTVRVTASGAVTAWDGNAVFSAGVLTLDNSGAVDWAVTNTITVDIAE